MMPFAPLPDYLSFFFFFSHGSRLSETAESILNGPFIGGWKQIYFLHIWPNVFIILVILFDFYIKIIM
jgi:hypothetical protein